MIFHYQVCEEKQERPDVVGWRGWTNCKESDSSELLVSMAIHKHMRNRGGLNESSDFMFVRVFWRFDDSDVLNISDYNVHADDLVIRR